MELVETTLCTAHFERRGFCCVDQVVVFALRFAALDPGLLAPLLQPDGVVCLPFGLSATDASDRLWAQLTVVPSLLLCTSAAMAAVAAVVSAVRGAVDRCKRSRASARSRHPLRGLCEDSAPWAVSGRAGSPIPI